jgi:hypothetical protein
LEKKVALASSKSLVAGKAVPVPVGAQLVEVRMTTFSVSYLLTGMLAPHIPADRLNPIAARWRALRDPYRPELHYMRGPGPKWREKHRHDNLYQARSIENCPPSGSTAR